MCGICITWSDASINTDGFKRALANLEPRGPDATITESFTIMTPNTGLYVAVAVGFTRLHIQGGGDLKTSDQPYRLLDGSRVVCNGEIFNAENLPVTRREGSSDCGVIPALLDRGLSLYEVSRCLDGDFAIVVIDVNRGTIRASRDPYGVRPLFYNRVSFASEIKGLVLVDDPSASPIQCVEPGTILTLDLATGATHVERWHEIPWLKGSELSLSSSSSLSSSLSSVFYNAVRKRLSTMRGIGACLSGGLDSSAVAAIAATILHAQGRPPLHTYSVGMEGSADLQFAREVAAHIGSIHHERILTPAECLAAIPEVVKAIESFDITTVRASVGNYLLGRFITEITPDVKVILNGDGADEVLGGYLYMRNAPDDIAFEMETTRLLTEIHRYDVLRSERCMAAHGLESRSPFLDRQFVAEARSIPTHLLRPTAEQMEKSVFRRIMTMWLPASVVWRRKEAFSDGISGSQTGSWFELAKRKGEELYGDLATAATHSYTVNPPKTAEALWYRELFHEAYHEPSAAIVAAPAMWMPRWTPDATDPSARTLTALYRQTF